MGNSEDKVKGGQPKEEPSLSVQPKQSGQVTLRRSDPAIGSRLVGSDRVKAPGTKVLQTRPGGEGL